MTSTLPPASCDAAAAAQLTPVQTEALARLQTLLTSASLTGLLYHPGTGASTVLRSLVARTGGRVLNAQDYTRLTFGHPPEQFDDYILAEAEQILRTQPVLVLDDLGPLSATSNLCGARTGWIRAMLRYLTRVADDTGHALVIAGTVMESWDDWHERFGSSALSVQMQAFGPKDYAALAATVAGEQKVSQIDFGIVHAGASQLNAWQLSRAMSDLARQDAISTADLLAWLARHGAVSNTRTEEVEEIDAQRLPGHEGIVEALDTHVVLAMDHPELALRLGIRPKRGVLLFGPPGTGKTSIGRLLARRMKGRFFLIDGSFVSEPAYMFYAKIEAVIAEAKRHAPSVLFIDDADALFGLGHIAGLSRYLLTLLDGLQSGSSNQVCVMMTAMDVEPIPPALLRSGRVELWLETRLPDITTRGRMLRGWLDNALPGCSELDVHSIAVEMEGFTPADIRRLAGDAKILFAADLAAGRPSRPASEYLVQAINAIVQVRKRLLGPASRPTTAVQDTFA